MNLSPFPYIIYLLILSVNGKVKLDTELANKPAISDMSYKYQRQGIHKRTVIWKDYIRMDDNGQLQENIASHKQLAMPPKTRGFAIASMVCGISSLLLCCLGLALPLAALGILFAILSHRKEHYMSGFSITGIITASSGMALGIIYLLLTIFIYQVPEASSDQGSSQEYNDYTEDATPGEKGSGEYDEEYSVPPYSGEYGIPPYFEEYFEEFPYFEGYDMPPYYEEYGGEYDVPDDFSGFNF